MLHAPNRFYAPRPQCAPPFWGREEREESGPIAFAIAYEQTYEQTAQATL